MNAQVIDGQRTPTGLIIAAPASGSGKTTVTIGLIAALRARGLVVQPYKVGPDYIDPGHHTVAAGRPSRNIDTWMCGREGALDSFSRGLPGCDITIIEGVMGLFDGREGTLMHGSTAEVAALLRLPVLLVVDVAGMSGSAAALVAGFAALRPEVQIAGVIINNVASERHFTFVSEAIMDETRIPLVGSIMRNSAVNITSRHLGLTQASEGDFESEILPKLRALIEESVDLDELIRVSAPVQLPAVAPVQVPGAQSVVSSAAGVRIAIARDEAFTFYYQENLERLSEAGAELVEFSPLRDSALPEGVSGLYLGGGYPELHAAELSGNRSMISSIGSAIDAGMPTYAECGGLMYLSKELAIEGARHPMVGAVDARATMHSGRSALGYRSVIAHQDILLGPAGTPFRGHEFHYSDLDVEPGPEEAAFKVVGKDLQEFMGFARAGDPARSPAPSLVASYLHVHFGCEPGIAPSFVSACRAWKAVQG